MPIVTICVEQSQCKCDVKCSNPDCKKNHSDTWKPWDICIQKAVKYDIKSRTAANDGDTKRAIKWSRTSIIYIILSEIKKTPDGKNIRYKQIYEELFCSNSVKHNDEKVVSTIETIKNAINNIAFTDIINILIQVIKEKEQR
jgi:hypothetical protein